MTGPETRIERENLAGPASGSGQRRVLTALNYDLVGSTRLLDSLDIEDYQDLIADFQREVRRAVVALAGVLQDIEGDGGMATFPIDMDAKDAASLAIQSGFEIIAACKRIGVRWKRLDLHVRVGIATSLSLVRKFEEPAAPPKVTGAALALATRLQAMANADTVFVSNETRSLARRSHLFQEQGTHELRGFAQPEQVWRAIGHRRKIGRYFAFGRLNAQLINRSDEQHALAQSWKRATEGSGQAILIEGEAGIGKSRLVHRIRASMRDGRARRLMLQCQPGGERSTLHPLLQTLPKAEETSGLAISAAAIGRLFREAGIYDPDSISVFAHLLGAEGAGQELKDAPLDVVREKAGKAARRALEELCEAGPLMLVVEDLHWIDPTSLHLLSEALRSIESLPVLVILTSRPAGDGRRWDLPNLHVLTLAPLRREDSHSVIVAKFPRHGEAGGPAMLDLIERMSGGVPLYIEEICQWASGNLQSAKEALAKNLSPNRLSAFEAVVVARLGQLGRASEAAGAAAAAGSRFDAALLRAMLPDVDSDAIDKAIDELVRQGFLVELTLSEPPLYGFRHALIRETIYKALLRNQRLAFHGRLYSAVRADRQAAPWIETAALAEHAENAGLIQEAIDCLVAAGSESAARSAFTEARQLLEHALKLCGGVTGARHREELQLRTMAALGPVLTTSEGPNSEPAQKLYEDGIEIARRRPLTERARWFPIFWGWWFTGSDVNGARAHALLDEMQGVDDPEVQLQSRHCVWAIDFYLGRHGHCVASVNQALPLYDAHPELQNPSQYGGHDTKVCGLVHRGLALWFSGKAGLAIASMESAKDLAGRLQHLGSIAHAAVNSAMLAAYRRDLPRLRSEIAALYKLTAGSQLPTLAATAQILEGWCVALGGEAKAGRDLMHQGLAIHTRLQTPEDYPVYCTMLAEVLVKTGEAGSALQLLDEIAAQSGGTGHLFWLAELHRRRGHLLAVTSAPWDQVLSAFDSCLSIAASQHAVPLLLRGYDTLAAADPGVPLLSRFAEAAADARHSVDPETPLYAMPEVIDLAGRKM